MASFSNPLANPVLTCNGNGTQMGYFRTVLQNKDRTLLFVPNGNFLSRSEIRSSAAAFGVARAGAELSAAHTRWSARAGLLQLMRSYQLTTFPLARREIVNAGSSHSRIAGNFMLRLDDRPKVQALVLALAAALKQAPQVRSRDCLRFGSFTNDSLTP